MGLPYRSAAVVIALGMAIVYVPDSLLPSEGAETWLFFDGHCNLCDGFVNFVAAGDEQIQIKFGAQQRHQELMKKHDAPIDLSTVVVIQEGKVYTKSTAVMRVIARMDVPFRYLSILYLIPSPIRDFGYATVAKYRYTMFGHSEKCRTPTKEFESRFLEYVEPTKPDFIA
jgi:predicted DCC family thiol-disulfide oxidoreductase YuxK